MAAAADSPARDVPDWLDARSRWVQGPSWLLSGLMHLVAAWLIWQLAQSPGCQARRGEQVAEGREVGIVLRERGPEDPGEPGGSPANQSPVESPASALHQPLAAPGRPPVPLSLPSPDPARVIGIGELPGFVSETTKAAGGPLVRSAGPAGRGDRRTGPGRSNGTSMYGIAAKGQKFVYVIDRSSSMTDVLVQAKNQLMASIRRLDESQAFQVIFFNNQPQELRNRFGLFHGTEADRQLVEEQLAGISASGGTNRLLALQTALKWKPDVVYFLTDAEDEMTAAERDDIRTRLKGAQINCIEFGIGPPVTGPNGKQVRNFLHKLAEQSGGGHVYIDITGGASR